LAVPTRRDFLLHVSTDAEVPTREEERGVRVDELRQLRRAIGLPLGLEVGEARAVSPEARSSITRVTSARADRVVASEPKLSPCEEATAFQTAPK
jgi:hypothetical protein